MTDRELLEFAAKAAGISYDPSLSSEKGLSWYEGSQRWAVWNPLTDDGDALRLAVALRMRVEINERSTVVYWIHDESEKSVYEYPDSVQDRDYNIVHVGQNNATRRAIVRAAAEIGRNIK